MREVKVAVYYECYSLKNLLNLCRKGRKDTRTNQFYSLLKASWQLRRGGVMFHPGGFLKGWGGGGVDYLEFTNVLES